MTKNADKKTTILSLFAGPGAGKSTSAAYLYAQLKNRGVNSELVREYVKDWAWEERAIGTYDQIYFLGKQVRREALLLGRVDAVVTDSPVWLGAYYAERYATPHIRHGTEAMVRAYYDQAALDGHRHVHLWVNRSKPYLKAGRYETEEQAREVDRQQRKFLLDRGVRLIDVSSDFPALEVTLKEVGF